MPAAPAAWGKPLEGLPLFPTVCYSPLPSPTSSPNPSPQICNPTLTSSLACRHVLDLPTRAHPLPHTTASFPPIAMVFKTMKTVNTKKKNMRKTIQLSCRDAGDLNPRREGSSATPLRQEHMNASHLTQYHYKGLYCHQPDGIEAPLSLAERYTTRTATS